MRVSKVLCDSAKKIKVAILGSGNIGTDLLIKVLRSPCLECSYFIGRKLGSAGMAKAMSLGVRVSDRSIDAIIDEPNCCDIVFDCTSAEDHRRHWPILESLGKVAIDLTPAQVGSFCIPAVNLDDCLSIRNLNMVSCGGQTSIPLAYVIGQTQENVDYIEVVSTIASRSAGPGTRINIDEYIHTTELGLKTFSGCAQTKAILNLNPAEPPIDMQTTVYARVQSPDIERLRVGVDEMISRIHTYVPGYQLIVPPTAEGDRVVIMVKVQGMGDYLQKYAGNLDIINCAALAAAEALAKERQQVSTETIGYVRKTQACQN
jgi:acetaldehyde dehydrogenase (acetylating)